MKEEDIKNYGYGLSNLIISYQAWIKDLLLLHVCVCMYICMYVVCMYVCMCA